MPQATRLTALLPIAIGLTALLGWMTGSPHLQGIVPGLVAMNPATAIAMILAGLSLDFQLSAAPRPRGLCVFLAVAVGLIGGCKLLSFAGVEFGLDRILFSASLGSNRMAPNTATSFFLLGFALLLMPSKKNRLYQTAQIAASLVLTLSFVALIGYAYRVETLYGIASYIPIALNTALGFLLLSFGVLLSRPSSGWMGLLLRSDAGGSMVRKMTPAVIAVPFLLGALALEGERRELYGGHFSVTLVVVGCILALIFFLFRGGRSLSRSERAYREQKQMLELILASMSDGVIVCDPNGTFTHMNPAAERLVGMEASALDLEKWIGRTNVFLPDAVTPFPREAYPLARAIRGEKTNSVEQFIQRPGSKVGIFISSSGRPILDDSGGVQGGVAVLRDITPQKRNEEILKTANEILEEKVRQRMEELKQKEDQLQQLQKMDAIGRLAGGVAHDFNNILGAITMYCDLVTDDPGDPASVSENVREIRQVSQRGAALTRQLLVFSRKQVVQLVPTDLNQLVQQSSKMLSRLIGGNIKLVTALGSDLNRIKVDPGQIEQVIMNLVVNARDAMPEGGKVTIETKNVHLDEEFTGTHLTVATGPYVMLTVSDSGMGMNAETQSKLFEPFFTTKPAGKGTGLGLTTVYGIVKQCQGTIWVYSEPGKGSVFKIYLPVTEEFAQRPEVLAPKGADARGSHTILLVEDDDRLRRGYSEILRRRGYDVLTAKNGKEALELLQTHSGPVDLLVTDVVMPELDGLALGRKAKELRNGLRILYMSGYADGTLEASGGSPDFQGLFLQKPFETSALISKVQEVLASG